LSAYEELRVYFKRIELQGFKSFAEPVTIEFQEGITCIVGPNGSGKSNISDAIRWVLGEQSPKALRGGKMEEVIFAGTAARRAKGMAEVTLVINNSSRLLPIDYAEVAIRRRMYRSGESEYSINGTRCRLRDVRELIMDTGIGVDGYSIIGQGEISRIVNSKPENRRELFEEAAGITKYRARKEESERKLDATSANLERVNDIVDEIESRIDSLREDSAKAKEYITLRDRYKELEINITLKNIENIRLKNEYIKDEIIELSARIEEIRGERAALGAEAAASKSRDEALETEGNAVRDRVLANANETSEIKNKIRVNEERKQNLARDKKRLAEEAETIAARLAKETDNLAALTAGAAETEAKLAELEESLNAAVARAAEKAELMSRAAAEADEYKSSIFESHRLRAAKENEIVGVKNLSETLAQRKDQIELERALADKSDTETEDAQSAARRRLASVAEELAGLIETRVSAEKTEIELSEQETTLVASLQTANLRREQLSARKKTIEEMEHNYEGYNSGIRSIMKSGVKGLRGVVAELIRVPRGFETAVETALGAALQNVVCDDEESAKAAIRYLKQNKSGRLTFLPVAGIRPPAGGKDRRVAESEGSLGYAVDCIEFDAELAPVFEYLLGRVLIADTLENAVRLSKESKSGLRCVTMEGEVVNAAGAMTGGAFRNKTANLLERRAEIGRLAEEITGLSAEKSAAEEGLAALKGKKSANAEALRRTEEVLREREIEKAGLENEIANLKARREELSNRRDGWETELRGIDAEMARSSGVTGAIEAEVENLKTASAEAERLAEAAALRCDSEKVLLDAANEELTRIRLAVGAAESDKNAGDALVRRVRESIAELTRDGAARRAAAEAAAEQEEELLAGESGLEALVAEKEAEKLELELDLTMIREKRAETARLADELAGRNAATFAALEKAQGEKYETEIRQAGNEARLESMKDRLWEEFEISYIQAVEFEKSEFVMSAAVKESREIKGRMKELGEVNVGAIKEYETVSERRAFLTEQRDDLLKAIGDLRKTIDVMDRTIKDSFKSNFDKVVDNFSETFSLLFGGGKGELRLEDESNPLECGIEINAQPPGKKLQNMNLLSGGEKTMTAIALMFSILKARPTPFCILDEVEAALDDSNIKRFAEYLTNFGETQFTLVTHQKATMEYADALYGVTMPERGVTKVLSLRLGDAETERFAEGLVTVPK
jgi:chromosome segregation protein